MRSDGRMRNVKELTMSAVQQEWALEVVLKGSWLHVNTIYEYNPSTPNIIQDP